MRAALPGVLLAVGSGLVYLLIAGSFHFDFKQTHFPHHLFMADALLHGQLHIRPEVLTWKQEQLVSEALAQLDRQARQTGAVISAAKREATISQQALTVRHDWAVYQGRRYGYWGLLTPLLMVPCVACWGVGISDQLIGALCGALNVGLFYWLLRRVERTGLCPMSAACRVTLTLLLALGTSLFWLSCAGQVWFTIQVVTLAAVLLAMLAACAAGNGVGQYVLAGACFGAAILGRSVVIFLGLFFITLIWQRCRADERPWLRSFLLRATAFCGPLAGALGVQAWYNDARFGDVTQSGLDIQIRTAGNPRFQKEYEQYGAFSLHYWPKNFKHYFWNCRFPRDNDGRLSYDGDGNSVFLMTPPLLYIFLAWRRWTAFAAALLAGVVPLVAMLLLFNGTGWVQFGPRYLLDATPLLLLLVAIGMRGRLTLASCGLVVVAIAVQLYGVSRVCAVEFGPLQSWISEKTLPPAAATVILAGVALSLWSRRHNGRFARQSG